MRKTFLEWLRHIESGRKKKELYEERVRRNRPNYSNIQTYYWIDDPY